VSSRSVSNRPVSNRRVSGHLAASSRTDLSGRLVPPSGGQLSGVRPLVLWRLSRPGVSPPWPLGARRSRTAFAAGVDRVPGGLLGARAAPSTAAEAWTQATPAEVVGRPRGACRSRVADLGRVAFGLRRRPRAAADRPGRPAWPGPARRRRLPWVRDARLLSVVVVEPDARVDWPQGAMSLAAQDGRAAPARPSQEVSVAGSAPTTL
jgi:hypothetical protein